RSFCWAGKVYSKQVKRQGSQLSSRTADSGSGKQSRTETLLTFCLLHFDLLFNLPFNPFNQQFIQPEPRLITSDEAQMPTALGRDQRETPIGLEYGMTKDLEGNERVVLGLHDQRRDTNPLQELIGRLGRIIMLGAAETEGRRGDPVVDFVYRANPSKIGFGISARCQEPLAHASEEPAFV